MALPAIGAVLMYAVMAQMIANIGPLSTLINRKLFSLFPTNIPTPEDLILQYYRGLLSYEQTMNLLKEQGYDNTHARNMIDARLNLLSPTDLIVAWRRGIIDENTLNTYLSYHQLNDEQIEVLKLVSEYFPTPSDLIRFAVREVYTPEIAEQYGLYQDIPPEYINEAYKAGLPEEQAKRYWAAHWELPSMTEGFAMLHRGIIDENECSTLLRALDYMPYWRDKLIRLSYEPYTRVDVRRMYRVGVLKAEDLIKAYKDLGYDDEKARNLAEFTIRYESDEDMTITRSALISAYKKGYIEYNSLLQALIDIGYPRSVAEFYAGYAEYEKWLNEVDDIKDELIEKFRLNIIDVNQLRDELTKLDIPTVNINTIIMKEIEKKQAKLKMPTTETILSWYESGVINSQEFNNYMTALGYTEEYILNYIEAITLKQGEREKKFLPLTQYLKLFGQGIISEEMLTTRLEQIGYSEEDIKMLIEGVKHEAGVS